MALVVLVFMAFDTFAITTVCPFTVNGSVNTAECRVFQQLIWNHETSQTSRCHCGRFA